MPEFISGLRLGGLFYEEAVKPVLVSEFAGLVHSAALIGYGSEVLGYDTPRSTDHEWGPRLLLFLTEEDYESRRGRITEVLHDVARTTGERFNDETALLAAVLADVTNLGLGRMAAASQGG